MKKAEDLCKELNWTHDSDPGRFQLFVNLIKPLIQKAQIDAIDAAVKRCAEEAMVEVVDHEELSIETLPANNGKTVILPVYGVDEDSINKVADKLKKELE